MTAIRILYHRCCAGLCDLMAYALDQDESTMGMWAELQQDKVRHLDAVRDLRSRRR